MKEYQEQVKSTAESLGFDETYSKYVAGRVQDKEHAKEVENQLRHKAMLDMYRDA